MQKLNDEQIKSIENDLIKFAGVIRNLLQEGKSLDDAFSDDRAEYWIKQVCKTGGKEF